MLALCSAACSSRDGADPPPPAADEGASATAACLENMITLASLDEPPLWHFKDSADTGAVRFVWLPAFDPAVSVRVIRRGDAYALVSRWLPVERDSGPSAPLVTDSIRIDAAAWNGLTRPLVEDVFWVPEAPTPLGIARLDGSVWWVDRVAGGRCRGVHYWSPGSLRRGAAVRAFGLLMLKAAGLSPERIY